MHRHSSASLDQDRNGLFALVPIRLTNEGFAHIHPMPCSVKILLRIVAPQRTEMSRIFINIGVIGDDVTFNDAIEIQSVPVCRC